MNSLKMLVAKLATLIVLAATLGGCAGQQFYVAAQDAKNPHSFVRATGVIPGGQAVQVAPAPAFVQGKQYAPAYANLSAFCQPDGCMRDQGGWYKMVLVRVR